MVDLVATLSLWKITKIKIRLSKIRTPYLNLAKYLKFQLHSRRASKRGPDGLPILFDPKVDGELQKLKSFRHPNGSIELRRALTAEERSLVEARGGGFVSHHQFPGWNYGGLRPVRPKIALVVVSGYGSRRV
jgi:hypothetical protein